MKALVLDAIGTALVLGVIAIVATRRAPGGCIARLGLRAGRLSARRAAWLTAGLVGLSQALDAGITRLGLSRGPTLDALAAALVDAGPLSRLALALAISVPPAVGEELLARGWIQRGLVPRIGVAGGIALGSALFGALHAHPVHGGAAFLLGAWLGWTTWRADGLRPAIAAHATNNAIAVLMLGKLEEAGVASAAGIAGAILAALVLATDVRAAFRDRACAPAMPHAR